MIQSTSRTLERMHTMSNKILLSLAMVGLFAATAKAGSYTSESSTNWVTVSAASAVIPNETNPTWDIPKSGTASRTGSYIDTDTEPGDPLKYLLSNVSALGGTTIRITGQIQDIVLHASAPATYSGETVPQAAIGATASAWYAWHCTGTAPATGTWVQMTGTAPAENDDPVVTIEFKDGYVRYGVGATPTWLTHTGDAVTDASGWMTNAMTFTAMNAIGLAGCGHFGDINGFAVKTITIDTDDEVLTAAIAAGNFATITGENIDLKATGATLTRRQAIILGMDSETTKPFVAPVQTGGDNSDKLGFKIGNANVGKYGADAAYTTFEVYECSTPNETGTLKASADAAGTAYVPTPSVGGGVKYYKIKIKFN